MNYNLPIIVLAVLCIIVLIVLLTKKQTDNFSGGGGVTPCGFTPNSDSESKEECLARCINETSGITNTEEKDSCLNPETGCVKICEDNTPNPCSIPGPGGKNVSKCIINNHTDIYGNSLSKCVSNCASNTCVGCSSFKIYDQNNGIIVSDNYTQSIKDFEEKCTPDTYNHKYCSPCVQACKACTDKSRCIWKNDTDFDAESRIKFKEADFKIGILPDDKSALIVWNEERNDVDKYYIYIYRKTDVNLSKTDDGTAGRQQTPLTIKTITKKFEKVGNNSHVITGLTNGETYSITLNKVSKHVEPQEIKVSNTIDVVPSSVKLVDFSKLNNDNSLKQKNLLSIGVFNELKGKTLDLTV
jgi:hypothetical protein